MRLINRSPYDTRTLRQVLVRCLRYVKRQQIVEFGRSWTRDVLVLTVGARIPKNTTAFGILRVPKLTGNEWHLIARGQIEGAFTTADFAEQALHVVWQTTATVAFLTTYLKDLPKIVPLKISKASVSRDVVQERYRRTLELERDWMRKQKLAGTKVKYYRTKRKYYEKRLAARKEDA